MAAVSWQHRIALKRMEVQLEVYLDRHSVLDDLTQIGVESANQSVNPSRLDISND